jgi:NTE family protein
MNPVPLEPTAAVLSDLTIAVSLSGAPSNSAVSPRTRGGRPPLPRPATIGPSLRTWAGAVAPGRRPAAPESSSELGDVEALAPSGPDPRAGSHGRTGVAVSTAMADIVGASLDTTGAVITRCRMAGNPPDVLITVPHDACRTMDFHLAADMIALGRARATRALDSADL